MHDATHEGTARSDVLCIRGFTVRRARATIVRRFDLSMQDVGVTAVVGRNGSGRTTLLEGIAGLLPSEGEIRVDGVRVDAFDAVERARRGIVLAPQRGAVFARLSVGEHLRLAGGRAWRRRAADGLTGTVARMCDERRDQTAGTLSGGERRLLAIAMVTLREPRIALLDEPSEGVARAVLPELVDAVQRLAATSAVLLADSDIGLLRATASEAVVLELGTSVLDGPFADIATTPAFRGAVG